jgi:anti-anti-sigma regulatory factor
MNAVNTNKHLVLDVGEVTMCIGGMCLVLLNTCRKTLEQSFCKILLANLSTGFEDKLRSFNMHTLFAAYDSVSEAKQALS